MIKGNINSIQTLGAVDGPGVRFVVFLQGCPLKCVCCHNPETKDVTGGTEYSALEIVLKAERYKEYFGAEGGITLSGGEPLMQPKFATEVFKECKKRGIHTCLDTSGYALTGDIKELLEYTDLVLLDIKYTNDFDYVKYAGCKMAAPLEFLDYLNKSGIDTWVRQVIIPSLNDSEDNILKLKSIIREYDCVKKIELLPFKKLCEVKYEEMGIEFPLKEIPEPNKEKMQELKNLLQ